LSLIAFGWFVQRTFLFKQRLAGAPRERFLRELTAQTHRAGYALCLVLQDEPVPTAADGTEPMPAEDSKRRQRAEHLPFKHESRESSHLVQ